MAEIPTPVATTASVIHALYAARSAAEQPRPYLGWSELGHPCERYLWLRWRWVAHEQIPGRLARLFDTGHREEARVLDDLRGAGVTVWDRNDDGRQFGVASVGGHLRGHCDAVALGLPEAPKTPHVVDVKTINTKRFDELLKKGMRALYPKYWAQAQGYMGGLQLERALFIFVCKDDDRIHCERVEFDLVEYQRLQARAEGIVRSAEPPPRINTDPAWFECKFCTFHPVCHGQQVAEVNCRTCAHSTAVPEDDENRGRWVCELERVVLDEATQRDGCNGHRFIPILLERVAEQVGAVDEPGGNAAVSYRLADGSTFTNGYPPHFTSREIRVGAAAPQMLGDAQLQALKAEHPGARLVSAAPAGVAA